MKMTEAMARARWEIERGIMDDKGVEWDAMNDILKQVRIENEEDVLRNAVAIMREAGEPKAPPEEKKEKTSGN